MLFVFIAFTRLGGDICPEMNAACLEMDKLVDENSGFVFGNDGKKGKCNDSRGVVVSHPCPNGGDKDVHPILWLGQVA